MALFADIMSGKVDLSRHAERMGGWLGPLGSLDPGADPPEVYEDLAGCRTPRVVQPDEPKR